jgi:hypothetical protein
MRFRIISLAAFIVTGGFLLAGCSSSSVRPSALAQAACVHRAKLAIRDSDFTEQLGVAGHRGDSTVSGRHGSYHAELDCAVDRRMERVVVTGPDPDQTERYKNAITRRF